MNEVQHTTHVVRGVHSLLSAVERGGNNLNEFKDVRAEHGSRQGQNVALTDLAWR